MNNSVIKSNLSRWKYLVTGCVSMLFAGIIYAWSILKVPLSDALLVSNSDLALNFTLTMCFFCIGGFLGSKLSAKIGTVYSIILSALLAGSGFVITGILSQSFSFYLFLTYGVLGGLGIGIAYNVIISTVSSWFPDKRGFCSGCLMMGFGGSSLILGNLTARLFEIQGFSWRKTYVLLGIVLSAVLIFTGLVIKRPDADTVLPVPQIKKKKITESFESKDYTPVEMLKRFTFWRAFVSLICLTAVGNSVISFARDLALSVGASAGLSTTLVGVLAVCNGAGRILTGALFDKLGRRLTMILANVITLLAAGTTFVAVLTSSLTLCIVGLCITGISYGTSPTVSSAFTAAFYGQKYFATNFSIMNFNLMAASFVATACSKLLASFGGYFAPFALLLCLSFASLLLCLTIKKP